MKTQIRNILFLVGLASVVVMVLTSGLSWQVLSQAIHRAGYWLVVIGMLWTGLYAMNTLTWRIILQGSGSCPIGFMRLMKITVSGFALNSATPVGLLGGEPYKILELTPLVGAQRATSSVVLFAMTHIFSHFWYWLTAIVLYVVLFPLSGHMAVLMAAMALFCIAGIFMFLKGYRYGMLASAFRLLGRLPLLGPRASGFAARHAESLQKIDSQIAELHGQSRCTFYVSLLLEYVGRMLQSLEVMFMLLLLGASCSWTTYVQSVLILAFTSLFANLLGFMPMQLGGREGGFAMSASQLGLTGTTGLFVSIICRVRELFFTCIGLALMKMRAIQ